MNTHDALNAFLDYHGFKGTPTPEFDGTISARVHNRPIKFVVAENFIEATFGTSTIKIAFEELDLVKHSQFTRFEPTILGNPADAERLQGIKADDVAVRLSLCFPGDIIIACRTVFFRGAGIQRNVILRRVV